MTESEAREIRREAHILRAGAGGNRVARYVAQRLIALTGGEAAMATQAREERDRIFATSRALDSEDL